MQKANNPNLVCVCKDIISSQSMGFEVFKFQNKHFANLGLLRALYLEKK